MPLPSTATEKTVLQEYRAKFRHSVRGNSDVHSMAVFASFRRRTSECQLLLIGGCIAMSKDGVFGGIVAADISIAA